MTTGATLVDFVSLRVHDPTNAEITEAYVLNMANMSVDDLVAASVVLPLAEDETLTIAANTFVYSIPATFAYLRELRLESAVSSGKYPNAVSPTLYRITIETGTTPIILFDENEFDPSVHVGKHLKVIGHKRPPAVVNDTTVVEPGLEAFIRERAIAYTASHLAPGDSEFAAHRVRIAQASWEQSERMLAALSREYKPRPDARRIPTR